MFTVTAWVGEERFADNVSYRPLRETLRLAWELAGGVPGAWVGIRLRGELIADLETNWRGELSEANVYARTGRKSYGAPVVVVTALNPRGPIFAGVFAA